MIIITQPNIHVGQLAAIRSRCADLGCQTVLMPLGQQTVINLIGDTQLITEKDFADLSGIAQIKSISKPYRLVSREFKPEDSVIQVGDLALGGNAIQVIAGPCSVETPEQMFASAAGVAAAGARLMRGGAFKPRTSPYSFQGHGETGLKYLVEAAQAYNLPVVTELMDARDLDTFMAYGVDVIQIGARSMQNFPLLKEVGRLDVPVVLKRGLSATIKEWLMAAEYIAAGGNLNIILAERGVRSYENAYRNMLDVSAIPFVKRETHLPVIVDPSHAGGKAWMVAALSHAAIAAGADGLLIESHPTPSQAWSDGDQALTPEALTTLMQELRLVANARGRDLALPREVKVGGHLQGLPSEQPLAA